MILLSIVTYTFTAYYSTGFFHADEHFQIIEFAGLKAGWNTYKDSVWEYHKQIRSSIQPTIAYGIISISKLFRINDPYTLSFILREITGLTLIYSLVLFHRNTQRFIQSIKHPQYNNLLKLIYLGFLLLIWYIPYLGVRFSSETWSAIFLVLALCFFFSEKSTKRNILITGLFFGLSFLFRFQIAFAIAGFGIYQFFYGSIKLKTTLLLIVGFLFVLMVGVFID